MTLYLCERTLTLTGAMASYSVHLPREVYVFTISGFSMPFYFWVGSLDRIDGQTYRWTGADPGGVQGVRTPALLIRVPFLKVTVSIRSSGMHKTHHFDIRNTKIFWGSGTGTFDTWPPMPLSDGLDTRYCKILDPPLDGQAKPVMQPIRTAVQ